MLPSVCGLLSQSSLLVLFQLIDALKSSRVLCYEGGPLEKRQNVAGQALCSLELLDIGEEGVLGDALEWISDLALQVLGQGSKLVARVCLRRGSDPIRQRSVLVSPLCIYKARHA